jgi:hypothetical protein
MLGISAHPVGRWLIALSALVTTLLLTLPSLAAGSFRVAPTEISEGSASWRVRVTIELPKAPTLAHVPLRFLFTKTAEYERTLVDGKTEPVNNRVALAGQNATVESLDVDFADGTGKVFKGTRFDFALTRTRGYVAGEYKMQVRTSDGVDIGTSVSLTLKGDNEPVDRRSMTFSAKDPKVKKVDDGTGAGKPPTATDVAAATGNGEVEPTGTAAPFIAPEAFNKTPEEELKVKKSGCGCGMDAVGVPLYASATFLPLLGLLVRRRTRTSQLRELNR